MLEAQYIKHVNEVQYPGEERSFCPQMRADSDIQEQLRGFINAPSNLQLLDGKLNLLKGKLFSRTIAYEKKQKNAPLTKNIPLFLPLPSQELSQGVLLYFEKIIKFEEMPIGQILNTLDSVLPGQYGTPIQFLNAFQMRPIQLRNFLAYWESQRQEGTDLPRWARMDSVGMPLEQALSESQRYQVDRKKPSTAEYSLEKNAQKEFLTEALDPDEMAEGLREVKAEEDDNSFIIPGRITRSQTQKGCKRQLSSSNGGQVVDATGNEAEACEYNPTPKSTGIDSLNVNGIANGTELLLPSSPALESSDILTQPASTPNAPPPAIQTGFQAQVSTSLYSAPPANIQHSTPLFNPATSTPSRTFQPQPATQVMTLHSSISSARAALPTTTRRTTPKTTPVPHNSVNTPMVVFSGKSAINPRAKMLPSVAPWKKEF